VRHRLNDALELTEMSQKADDWYQKLSTGERRRLDIARAILPDPSILLLDEPTLGIDVASAHKLRGFIRDELCRKEGKTVLLTTHNMDEAEELCDKVAIIDHGKIVACDQPTGIMQLIQPTAYLVIEALNITDRTISEIEVMDGVTELSVIDKSGNRMRLRAGVTSPDVVGPRICRGIIEAGGDILLMNRHLPSLEESFLRLTGESEA